MFKLSHSSIVISFWLSWTLKFKVLFVVFFRVPFVLRIHNINTPTHHGSCFNSIVGSWEFWLEVFLFTNEWIITRWTPLHKTTLVILVWWEINNPVLTGVSIYWMTMNMLSLWHVDSSNSVSHNSRIRLEMTINRCTTTTWNTVLLSSSETNSIFISHET